MAKLVGARAYNSGNISVAVSGTPQNLTFDSERFDTDTIHSTVTNTGRLTCNTAGKYVITASVAWASNSTGFRQIGIYLNNSTFLALQSADANATAIMYQSVTTVYDLSASDYVELRVLQTSGGPLNIVAGGNYSPEFSMHRIG